MAAARQPPWVHPATSSHQPDLKVYNSLTRSKVPFVPRETGKISWYSCGPTVYDDAHLGHARNYVTIDILRRILHDYFHFDIHFVMNITDVDDKIILAGRKRYLYKQYQQEHRYIDQDVMADVLRAWHLFVQKRLPQIPQSESLSPAEFNSVVRDVYGDVLQGRALDGGLKPGDKEAKIKMYIRDAQNTARALTSNLNELTPAAFYELSKDAMCDMLDAELAATIKGTDYHIFKELTEEYERRFMRDMADLNVLPPDRLVRVTEYGDEIARFVDQIVGHGYAYNTPDGSVYFDIRAFEAAGNPYARLEPWNRNDKALQADGEGALSHTTSVKKSEADFALWKASKPGEMSWSSKWGDGRPGWHIECSAMASDVLGQQMDIHSGGIDLAFPHHDNELAQSEAYWHAGKSSQWVNYFMHMGHLSIAGSKMSKSLKNFTTIRAALDRGDWTSRSLRIVFLLGSWRDGIEITDDLVKAGMSWEDRMDNFFIRAREAAEDRTISRPSILSDALSQAENKVRLALLDSFNTPEAMAVMSQLVNEYNTADRARLSLQDHIELGVFLTRMVNIFGLNGDEPADTVKIGWAGIDVPEAALEYIEPLARLRDQLRALAIAKSATHDSINHLLDSTPEPTSAETNGNAPSVTSRSRPTYKDVLNQFIKSAREVSTSPSEAINKAVLSLCDKVRDQDLWNLAIYLEDREGQSSLIRPVTAGLRAARQEKEEKARQKDHVRKQREAEARQKQDEAKLPPQDMFKPPYSDEYGAWDESGIPTQMKDGTAVTASKLKRLRKDYARQAGSFMKWVKMQQEAQAREQTGGR